MWKCTLGGSRELWKGRVTCQKKNKLINPADNKLLWSLIYLLQDDKTPFENASRLLEVAHLMQNQKYRRPSQIPPLVTASDFALNTRKNNPSLPSSFTLEALIGRRTAQPGNSCTFSTPTAARGTLVDDPYGFQSACLAH